MKTRRAELHWLVFVVFVFLGFKISHTSTLADPSLHIKLSQDPNAVFYVSNVAVQLKKDLHWRIKVNQKNPNNAELFKTEIRSGRQTSLTLNLDNKYTIWGLKFNQKTELIDVYVTNKPDKKTNLLKAKNPSGWLFDLPKHNDRIGKQGTAEVSGACYDQDGSLWSIGDGGLNGGKITRTKFDQIDNIINQKIFYITAFNRDMEWLICDQENNTLIIGDTGENNRKKRDDLEKLKIQFNKSQITYNEKLFSKKDFRTVKYWEAKVERSFDNIKNYLLMDREARIYVYNLNKDSFNEGYDGKKYLSRIGFIKLKYNGGPLDVEAAVLKSKNSSGDKNLYLFEKVDVWNRKPLTKVMQLNISEILNNNIPLKTSVPLSKPHLQQHLNLEAAVGEVTFITDAALTQDDSTLYLLTNNSVIRYQNWDNISNYKTGEYRQLPESFQYYNMQLESLSLKKNPDGTLKMLMGSDLGNYFVSFDKFIEDEELTDIERSQYDWNSITIPTGLEIEDPIGPIL